MVKKMVKNSFVDLIGYNLTAANITYNKNYKTNKTKCGKSPCSLIPFKTH